MLDDLAMVVAPFVQSHFETKAVNIARYRKPRRFDCLACLQSRNEAKPCMDRKGKVDKKKHREINEKKRERGTKQKENNPPGF